MKETVTACILIILFTAFGLYAGYKIRGAENQMDCSRENTVIIHKGVRR